MRSSLFVVCLAVACGGSPPEARPEPKLSTAAARAPAAPPRPANTLYRSEVVRFVERGFWSFLQRVEVEPSLEEGRFRGWIIVSLHPPDFWQGVDLAPGDIVTSVNDLPIERDTEAFDAFQSLKTASALRVEYLRRGSERELSYRIAD